MRPTITTVTTRRLRAAMSQRLPPELGGEDVTAGRSMRKLNVFTRRLTLHVNNVRIPFALR